MSLSAVNYQNLLLTFSWFYGKIMERMEVTRMHLKTTICAALISLACAFPVFAADCSAQIVSFSEETSQNFSVALTDSKVITDGFSFKIPKDWTDRLVMVQDGVCYDIYDRIAYETDGSGLLFTILSMEDVDYRDLEDDCHVLAFCKNRTYILQSSYGDFYEDDESAEYQACEDALSSIKKSFVLYVKEPAL